MRSTTLSSVFDHLQWYELYTEYRRLSQRSSLMNSRFRLPCVLGLGAMHRLPAKSKRAKPEWAPLVAVDAAGAKVLRASR